jgi:hypothetical protein
VILSLLRTLARGVPINRANFLREVLTIMQNKRPTQNIGNFPQNTKHPQNTNPMQNSNHIRDGKQPSYPVESPEKDSN